MIRAYHGDFIDTPDLSGFRVYENGWLAVDENGTILSLTHQEPKEVDVIIEIDGIVIPAFSDLHLHSSQLAMTGLCNDGTGQEWFSKYCHPTEQAYSDPNTAHLINQNLISELKKYGSFHANIMSTVSLQSTLDLAEQLENSGLEAFLGKMNSDYNEEGTPNENTEESIFETKELIRALKKNRHVHCTIAPEYIPACSMGLMKCLGDIALCENLPVHTHMNENEFDTGFVETHYPVEKTYAKVYDSCHLFGETKTVMAHCTYADDEAFELMAKRGIYLAYSPYAVTHIPNARFLNVKEILRKGVKVGLASDIGGGHTLDMRQVIQGALYVSKLSGQCEALKLWEAFYLATKGSGSFFGNTGSFEIGNRFDALIIDDSSLNIYRTYTLQERLERYIYCGDSSMIEKRISNGKEI